MILFILYDSITNSVFEGQILAPLLHKIATEKCNVHIISFERALPHKAVLDALKQYEPLLTVTCIKRMPFLGAFSLYFERQNLNKLIPKEPYSLIVRGPLAALCAQPLIKHSTEYIIQARGLLADEYRYTHHTTVWYKKPLHRLRAYQLAYYEKKGYRTIGSAPYQGYIESVSTALSKHLADVCTLSLSYFKRAYDDVPQPLTQEQKNTFKITIREQLHIPKAAFVYVYNGSAKPWQCPLETVCYFKKQYIKNRKCFLLILSQDVHTFKAICQQYNIPHFAYRILTIEHTKVLSYLCAADCGIILRKHHIINWVSRPTKVLEYQAAHIPIYHNNTIALLTEKD